VAFASRSLTETESRYAQIEKEALALTWACEKFSEYVLGRHIQLETDHKPLVPILGQKRRDSLPPRVLRFRIRLMRFQYTIHHSPGKTLFFADALSRAPLRTPDERDIELGEEVEKFVNSVITSLPAEEVRLNEYRRAQAEDTQCSKVIEFCKSGWPVKHKIHGEAKKFWQVKGALTYNNDLLLYGSRIVIPEKLRKEAMEKIHAGHQGIVRCRLRVAESVWWPGVSKEIETFIQSLPSVPETDNPSQGATPAIYIAELSMGESGNRFVRVGQGDLPSRSRLFFEVY
jgi:hypothetical protein